MIEVSIDMSKNDETAENRIFAKVIDIQDNTLLCEYLGANYDYENAKIVGDLQIKLSIAKNALEFCSRTYPMCNLKIVKQALAKIKE